MFEAPDPAVDVFVVDTAGGEHALALTTELRAAGVSADRAYEQRSMKAQIKAADRSGARYAVIVGTDELDADVVVMRPLHTREDQRSVPRADLVTTLRQHLQEATS